MAIELRYQTVNTNATATFTFDRSVLSNIVGISYFDLSYGSKDHHIQKVSLSIATSWAGNVVSATVTAQLTDSSGNLINNAASSVRLVCIANTDSVDGNLALATQNGIPSGGQSPAISIPGGSLKFAQVGISGFNLAFSDKDHHLRQMLVAMGFSQHSTSGQISAEAAMTDSDGHSSANETANGVLLAGNYSEQGLKVISMTNQQTSSAQDVTFDGPVSAAVVLINAFTITFKGDDHHVKSVGAGCSDWAVSTTDPKIVTLDNARAFCTDNSGHVQDDSASFVNLTIVGIPQS